MLPREEFFEGFEPIRVEQGEAISRIEMKRRIAHYLHIPQKYGERIITAFDDVMQDALMHGEGFKIPAGTLRLLKHPTEQVTMLGGVRDRTIMFKYKWTVSANAREYLARISHLYRLGVIEEYFKDPATFEDK